MFEKKWIVILVVGLVLIFFMGVKVQAVPIGSSATVQPPSDISVKYDEFKLSALTTNFSALEPSELLTITNFTLDNSTWGKIEQLEIINLAAVFDENHVVDLDRYIEFGPRSCYVDTVYFYNLARPVNISFYEVRGIERPRILRNGVDCEDCVIVQHDSNVLKFVSQSGLTSSEEVFFELVEWPKDTGPGARPHDKVLDFSVSEKLIDVSLRQGQASMTSVVVENNGDFPLVIEIGKTFGISPYVFISKNEMYLNVNEKDSFDLFLTVPENEVGRINTGSVYVRGILDTSKEKTIYREGKEKNVDIILKVIEKEALFDLISGVKNNFLKKGEYVKSQINLVNVGDKFFVDVEFDYYLKDFDNKENWLGNELIYVDRQQTIFDRSFKVPENLGFGSYLFYVRAKYNGKYATSANIVSILPEDEIIRFRYWPFILAITLFVLLFYELVRHKFMMDSVDKFKERNKLVYEKLKLK